jgi:hypothetical protein
MFYVPTLFECAAAPMHQLSSISFTKECVGVHVYAHFRLRVYAHGLKMAVGISIAKLKHNMNMGMDADTDTDVDTDKDADTDRDIDVVRICPCPCMCPSLYPCCVRVYVWILPCLFPWAAFDAYFTIAKWQPSMLKLLHSSGQCPTFRAYFHMIKSTDNFQGYLLWLPMDSYQLAPGTHCIILFVAEKVTTLNKFPIYLRR